MAGQTNAERGRDVRERLLAAARELIGELGWNAVSTRTLAERAGVRPGLVHYHFDSLRALLRQAALGEIRRILDDSSALFADPATAAEGVETTLTLLDSFTGTDPTSLLVSECYLAGTRDPELRAQLGALVDDYRATLAAAFARSGHPAPEAAANVVMAVLDGFVLHKGLNPRLSAADIAPVVRTLTRSETNGAPE